VKVVSTKGDAVCKIITHIVQFDFEMPFKPADDAQVRTNERTTMPNNVSHVCLNNNVQAIGTGFFVDLKSANASEELIKSGDKFVVTNAHVIESAAKVWITTPKTGEERFDAVVCGVCFDIDLCVLKIRNCPDTPTISLGDSNKVLVGQSVVALGHPLGMNSLKLTEGVISGREDGLFQVRGHSLCLPVCAHRIDQLTNDRSYTHHNLFVS
jgi:S1-C subfamily serine protease